MKIHITDPVFTSKYLVGLFSLETLLFACIDFAPGGEVFQIKAIAVCLQCAILFALLIRVFRQRTPWEWFRIAYAGFALIMTFLFMVMLIG